MSSKFEVAFLFIRLAEGGYGRDPADAGGETFMGVSRAAHASWPGWAVLDEAGKAGDRLRRALARDAGMIGLVRDFYRVNYWERHGLEEFPVMAGVALLDGFVQHGCAARLVKQAFNRNYPPPPLAEDNVLWPADRARLTQASGDSLAGRAAFVEAFLRRREEYYQSLASRPGQAKFLRGWLSRLERLRDYLAGLGPGDDPAPPEGGGAGALAEQAREVSHGSH
jgi:lysozyme family protein